jgi:hypothetical protein
MAEQANEQDDRRLGHTDAMAARKRSRSDTAPSEGTTVDEMEKAVAPEYHLNEPNSEHGGLRNVRQHPPPSALQHLRQSWCNPWRPCSILITLIGRQQRQCLPHLLPSLPLHPQQLCQESSNLNLLPSLPLARESRGSWSKWPPLVWRMTEWTSMKNGNLSSIPPSVHHEEYDYMDIDDDF